MKMTFRALASELLKLRRTLALWVVVIAPTLVALLYFLILLSDSGKQFYDHNPEAWMNLAGSVTSIWTIIVLPLFITLESALLANIEHNHQQWKHLFSLPIPRRTIYLAKWLCLILLTLGASFVLFSEILLTGMIMRTFHSGMGFEYALPLGWITAISAGAFAASLLIISIHTWVSLRFKSFAFASGVGIAASIANVVVTKSSKYAAFYPWSMPLASYEFPEINLQMLYLVALGGGLLAALLGMVDFTRQDVLA